MIHIVFFDIDGTLMHDKQISETTVEAIELLKAQDILPVLATGRPEYEVKPIRERLGIEWALTCNGAHVGYNGRTITGKSFSRSLLRDWLAYAADDSGGRRHTFLLYGASKMYASRPNCPLFLQAREEIGFAEPLSYDSPEELPEIYQCILFCPEEEALPYTKGREEELYIHRWRPWAVDFNPAGVHKAAGVQILLDHLGLRPEQAAAFGDGRNDIEMIRHVGLGVAMGNACAELIACADHVTRHAGDDGILHGVKTLILP